MEKFKTYYWETEEPHSNNTETLYDFLENHFKDYCPGFEVVEVFGNFAVIKKWTTEYEIHAFGNGDFTHHQVEFTLIT